MIRHGLIISILVTFVTVHTAKQKLQLSESYLPVAMQVIAHLTDQMAYEAEMEVTPSSKPSTTTTPRPAYETFAKYLAGLKPSAYWWLMSFTFRHDETTPYHKPGYYAPVSPPTPDRYKSYQQRFVLLPFEQHAPYTVIKPQETKTEAPLLSIHHEQIRPLVEPSPKGPHLLPPHFDVKVSSRSDGGKVDDEFSDENLQYLSDDVKEMIKMARDPDDGMVNIWDELRSGPNSVATKAKLSTSNLRLLLLYDLLSRDAKRQRLSDFVGFSPEVMKFLVESSNGGAREQLRMALDKMVQRHDCGHEYANNRAREMVVELAKAESKLSSELRYLQPLVYKF